MFYLPHGLTVDHEDNLWLTDVGSHQVCEVVLFLCTVLYIYFNTLQVLHYQEEI